MNDLSNFIRFNENNTKLTGNVAALDFDFNIFGEKLNSDNEETPAYRLFGHAARTRFTLCPDDEYSRLCASRPAIIDYRIG